MELAKINSSELPNLYKSEVMKISLTSSYWQPDEVGEEKRVFFNKVELEEREAEVDEQTGEIIKPSEHLLTAFFFEQKEDGGLEGVKNSSTRLVGDISRLSNDGTIGPMTPLLIVYRGKKKNQTNEFNHDVWSIYPIKLEES